MAGLQHLQLYTYESLVSNIQRTINVTVTQRDLAQPTGHTVEMLYIKFIQAIYALDVDDYLLDLYNEPEPVNIVVWNRRKGYNIFRSNLRMPLCCGLSNATSETSCDSLLVHRGSKARPLFPST